ncbi:hypothetical protein [Phreatobacter sp.]|uniref:hypothetical protein n=1 Tax=Phreatobacter sp. TaxID=1966341 RepID=UPI003F717ED9
MTPLVTVAFGGLSAEARLPGWTLPFVVRLADRFVLTAANGGLPLRLVHDRGSVTVVDEAPGAFAREYGAVDRPAMPRLGPAVAAFRAGGAA